MNIYEYLKASGRNAWLMNDYRYMVWEGGEWVVRENQGKVLKHTIIYQGKSVQEAINAMREIDTILI